MPRYRVTQVPHFYQNMLHPVGSVVEYPTALHKDWHVYLEPIEEPKAAAPPAAPTAEKK